MSTQPKKYVDLEPFLVFWVKGYPFALNTPEKLVESLSCEGEHLGPLKLGAWSDYPTAFRRLRQDARLRVATKFLGRR